jgi:hypothetical protein
MQSDFGYYDLNQKSKGYNPITKKADGHSAFIVRNQSADSYSICQSINGINMTNKQKNVREGSLKGLFSYQSSDVGGTKYHAFSILLIEVR